MFSPFYLRSSIDDDDDDENGDDEGDVEELKQHGQLDTTNSFNPLLQIFNAVTRVLTNSANKVAQQSSAQLMALGAANEQITEDNGSDYDADDRDAGAYGNDNFHDAIENIFNYVNCANICCLLSGSKVINQWRHLF